MEYSYELDIKTQKKNYLFGYYNRPVLWFQRRFLPILLLIISAFEFFFYKNTDRYLIPLFFGILGAYYIVRPFVFLRRIHFQNTVGTISISKEELKISDEKGELKILPSELLKIVPKKHYLFLKVRIHAIQYFLIDLNSIRGDSKNFVKELEEFTSERKN
ncbi:hypothetical protein [Leptospira adleri]|uniref:YcxB-like protein domain-containing protein n=1 Tax=Leptospira adleri TaxID=2023186 RepID=A0A2M9YP03_9LEPT|nr:hypothetical protein [Leptospira adleri]PJZ53286.1 hypothetical protein CH380_10795 [Leptospira adleri]PJZ63906.1 hypothetical protein CH376_00315 [Leptospira adleri]